MLSKIKIFGLCLTMPLLLGFFPFNNSYLQSQDLSMASAEEDGERTILDVMSHLSTKNEHYAYTDTFVKEYQQADGGYIDTASLTGHLNDKEQGEPNQKWHFFESWLFPSFKDGTFVSLADDAKAKMYSRLQSPELLLWIFEASGVEEAKVEAAYNAAVEGRVQNLSTATIAKNMRSAVLWDDLLTVIPKLDIDYSTAGENPDIDMLDFSSFLIDKKEHYPISDSFVQQLDNFDFSYVELAKTTGHAVDQSSAEPNQKWHFYEFYLLDGFKNGTLTLASDAYKEIYQNMDSPELMLYIFEASGINESQLSAAKEAAESALSQGLTGVDVVNEMKEIVSWEDITSLKSVTTSPTRTTITVGGNDRIVSAVTDPIFVDEAPTWSIVEGEENITIAPNGKEVSIHPVKEGKAIVRVSYSETIYYDCNVTIKAAATPTIVGVSETVEMIVGETLTLTPSLSTGGGTFNFESSNPTIASITSEGLLSALTVGETTIIITNIEDPSITTTVTISVTDEYSSNPGLNLSEVYATAVFGPDYNSKKVNTYDSEWSATNGGFTWNIAYFSNYNNNWNYIKCGKKGEPSVSAITTREAYPVALSKVVLTIGQLSKQDKINSIVLKYGESLDDLSSTVSIDKLEAGEHEFIIPNPASNLYYQFEFDIQAAGANGIVQVDKIEYYRNASPSDLANQFVEIFTAKMNEKCVAPYNLLKETDWDYLANLYSTLPEGAKTIFHEQYNLYRTGESLESYSQVFSTYIYIVEVKYGFTDFMELGLTRKMNNASYLSGDKDIGLTIILLFALTSIGAVGLMITKHKKIIKK